MSGRRREPKTLKKTVTHLIKFLFSQDNNSNDARLEILKSYGEKKDKVERNSSCDSNRNDNQTTVREYR